MGRSSSSRRPARLGRTGVAALVGALLMVLGGACAKAPDFTAKDGAFRVGIRTEPSPAELGENGFAFQVERNGRAVPDADVSYRMFMPGMPMSTDDVWVPAPHEGGGRYTAKGDFAMGGAWQVEVQVRAPDGGTGLVRFPYQIKWELK